MIGKIKDAVSAAFVIGAVDKGASAPEKQETTVSTKVNEPTQAEIVSPSAIGAVEEVAEIAKSNNQQNKQKNDEIQLDEDSVSQMTEELNKLMQEINCKLEFQYSKEVNMMTVRMIDKETKEVIKEYPPEDMIKGMIKAREWLGAFLDKNA